MIKLTKMKDTQIRLRNPSHSFEKKVLDTESIKIIITWLRKDRVVIPDSENSKDTDNGQTMETLSDKSSDFWYK